MESGYETIELDVRNYISPECSCKIEDIVNAVEHVVDASFDPVNNLLKVRVHRGMISAKDITRELGRCRVSCEERKSVHEMAHMEHEAMKMKKPAAHDHHAMMEAEMKRHFIVAAIFTIPVLILSPSIQMWLRYTLPPFSYWSLLLVLCASVVILYGGFVFYRDSIRALRMRSLDMNVLVSIALLSAYLYSLGSTFLFVAPDFYWEISTLATFILFGHWMEMKAVRSASGALKELVKLIPPMTNVMRDGEIFSVPTFKVKVGDIVLIRPGGNIPVDGQVIEGETSVNEAMVTGESKPVEKRKGSEVVGGTINVEGAIQVRVTKTGEQTAIAQIIRLVEQAITSKPKVQKRADRAASYLTLTAIIVGAGTFFFWFWVRADSLFALTLAITVIVITCPHALGLAIPTVTSVSTTIAAKKGILIKNADALEIAKTVDIIVFDKTGTLTKGEFGVTDIVKLGDWSEKEIIETAAAIEINSEHVIARGIVNKAKEAGLHRMRAESFTAIPGKGAKAIINKDEVYVGNMSLLKDLKLAAEKYSDIITKLSFQGKTVVYVATHRKLQGLIAMADLIRDESKEAVNTLKQLGLEVAMLTGDNKQTAAYVAKELNLDTYFAEVLPEQKANTIKRLQSRGKRVAMVGDGINDAPALVQANVGIAIGAGTDVAVESADVVLIKNDPRDVSKLINLSKKTMRKMNENLVGATGYNVLAIPIAAGILIPFGLVLRPEFAAITMSLSSITVVLNALLLRRAKI
ncbi:MAG: copper-translocating P-type ATPase [Candidatus Atabeyarchaeum deiterrae]